MTSDRYWLRAHIHSIKGHRSRDPNFIVQNYGVHHGYSVTSTDFGQLYPGHFGAQILSVSVMIGLRDTYIKLPK